MAAWSGTLLARGVCDGALLTALLTIFGTSFFWLAFAPLEAMETQRLAIGQRLLGTIQLALWPLKLLLVVSTMAGTSVIGAIPFAAEVLRDTHFGHDFLASAPLAVFLAAAIWIRVASARRWSAFVLSGTLLLIWACSSHAIDLGMVPVLVYAIHELAAGLWVGSLVSLWAISPRHPAQSGTEAKIPRQVSAVSGWCVAALVVTGLYTAGRIASGHFAALFASSYGRILLLKVTLFAVIVAMGAYNRFRILPAMATAARSRSLLRNVALEIVLIVSVFAIAGLLANSSPPP